MRNESFDGIVKDRCVAAWRLLPIAQESLQCRVKSTGDWRAVMMRTLQS